MAEYLAIASDIKPFDDKPITAPEVFDLMMEHGCWEFGESAPHRRHMKKGDRLLFYLGGNHGRYLAGEAVIADAMTPIDDKSPTTFNRDKVPFFSFRVPLKRIRRYPPGELGVDTLAKLSFVRNSDVERKYIGLLLRGGVRKLEAADLALVEAQLKQVEA